jgi:serine/threonine-protein kinase RsbW
MNKPRVLKIGSSPDEMFRVERFVEEISDEHMLYGNYFGNILMAVTEAVQNAMTHGNRMNALKRVTVTGETSKEGLWIRVTDEGDGFDFNHYANTAEAEQDLLSGKKGLFLIHKLADEVYFKNGGRIIEMLFRINGIDESIFERRVAFMQEFFKVYSRLNT